MWQARGSPKQLTPSVAYFHPTKYHSKMIHPPQTHCALDEASSSPGNGLKWPRRSEFFLGEETAGNKQMAPID